MNKNLKEYVKVVKLSYTQAQNILNYFAPMADEDLRQNVITILTSKLIIQVDRSHKDKIVVYSNKCIINFYKTNDQSCRYIIMASVTAKNYSHFYANIRKKFGCVPKKSVESEK